MIRGQVLMQAVNSLPILHVWNCRIDGILILYRAPKIRSAEPVDPVEFPRCFGIRLGILSSDRQTHRMSLPHITSDHPQMSNVLLHNSSRLRLDLQALERIWGTRQRVLKSFSPDVLYRCKDKRFIIHGRERHTAEWRRGRGGGEERGKLGDLGRCEVPNFLSVMDLQSCTKSVGCLGADAVECSQRLLVKNIRKTRTRRVSRHVPLRIASQAKVRRGRAPS